MAEATRLTRAGRLAEATTLIQRTLGDMSAPTGRSTHANVPNETKVRVVEVDTTFAWTDDTGRSWSIFWASPSISRYSATNTTSRCTPTNRQLASFHPEWKMASGQMPYLPPPIRQGSFVDGAYRNTGWKSHLQALRPWELYGASSSPDLDVTWLYPERY